MHISAKLIKSYRREYGSWSWAGEKLLIPLQAHHKAQLSETAVLRQKLKRAVIFFYLLANPSETAYLSVRDGELSNAVRLV